MSEHTGFSCMVTGFKEQEHEILRLRNANRERAETLDYLSWRYCSAADAPEPRVFWLADPTGVRVGMAAAIFRPYRINEVRTFAAVIGDISLDARCRGRGLGQLLLRFMTQYLDRHFPEHPAFVIPTEAARRTLASIGWVTLGALVPYVCVLDSTRYFRSALHSRRVAAALARPLQDAIRGLARLRAPRDGALFLSSARDGPVVGVIRSASRPGAMRDLGLAELNWRYMQHPHSRFVFGHFYRADTVCGISIFEDDRSTQTCTIYDLATGDPSDLRALLSLLVLRGLAAGLTSVRMVLDNKHPARSCLRELGFVARRADSVFQVHSGTGTAEAIPWRVTQGDKDT